MRCSHNKLPSCLVYAWHLQVLDKPDQDLVNATLVCHKRTASGDEEVTELYHNVEMLLGTGVGLFSAVLVQQFNDLAGGSELNDLPIESL